MASEIRVNKINSRTGVGTITLSPTGVDFTGITTVATLKATTGIVTTLSVTGTTTLNGNLDLQDNDKILAGTGDDLEFYHDGTHSHIVSNTGNLRILADGSGSLVLTSKAGEEAITCAQDGAVTIKHDNSTKFATTSDGITVSGRVTCDEVRTGDDDKIQLGDSQDFRIYHDGSTNIIDGHYHPIELRHQSEVHVKCVDDGAVELYYDNDLHFATTSDGCKTNGDLSFRGDGDVEQILFDASDASLKFVDNKKAKFGNGDDLEIYHNGTDSVINDSSRNLLVRASGTGDLWLQSDNQVYFGDIGGNETFIEANDNGDVKLFYDNSQKLATKSDGVVVTGGIYLDGSGGTDSANKLDDYEEGTWTPIIRFGGASTGVVYSTYNRGWYTKIGRIVVLKMALEVTNKGSSTGVASIVVPFNSSLTSSSHAQMIPHSKVNANAVFAYGTAGSGEFALRHTVASTSTGMGSLNNGDFGTSFSLVGSITYML